MRESWKVVICRRFCGVSESVEQLQRAIDAVEMRCTQMEIRCTHMLGSHSLPIIRGSSCRARRTLAQDKE